LFEGISEASAEFAVLSLVIGDRVANYPFHCQLDLIMYFCHGLPSLFGLLVLL